MGTNYSGLFKNTKGARDREVKSSAERMHRDVTNWAHKEIKKMGGDSNRKRNRFNTASIVYDEKSGRDFYGRNKGALASDVNRNPTLFGENSILPKESLNEYPLGNCSEVDAINQALNAGAKLEDLYLMTINTHTKQFGMPKESCENCTFAFRGRIKKNHSGWKEF